MFMCANDNIFFFLMLLTFILCGMDKSPQNTRIILQCTDGALSLTSEMVKAIDLPVFTAANEFGGYQDEFCLDEHGISRTAAFGLINLMCKWRTTRKIEAEDVKRASGNPLELYKAATFLLFDPAKKQIIERLCTEQYVLPRLGNCVDDALYLVGLPETTRIRKLLKDNWCRETSKHYLCAVTGPYARPRTTILNKITGQLLWTIDGCSPEISSDELLVAVKDGNYNDDGCGIKIWNLKTGDYQGYYGCGHSFQFSPDGKFLLCGFYKDCCYVWDTEKRSCILKQTASWKHTSSISFCGNAVIKIIDKNDGIKRKRLFNVFTGTCIAEEIGEIGLVDIIADGQFFATVVNGFVRIVDVAGKVILECRGSEINTCGILIEIIQGAYSLGSRERELWNVATRNCVFAYDGFQPKISSNGTLFLASHSNETISVHTIDGNCLLQCPGQQAQFSPDGTIVVVLDHGEIMVYVLKTKEPIMHLQCNEHRKSGFCHCRNSLLVINDYLVFPSRASFKIGSFKNGNVIEIEGSFVGFDNPDNPKLFVVEIKALALIKIFDLSTQSCIKEFAGSCAQMVGKDIFVYNFLQESYIQRIFYDLSQNCAITPVSGDKPFFIVGFKENILGLAGVGEFFVDKRVPAVRMLFDKLILQQGVLSEQERINLDPIYRELSDTEKSVVVAGRTISEIFQAPNV